MTLAPPKLLEARRLLLRHLDIHPGKMTADDLDPAEIGVVPDSAHVGGYHCGKGRLYYHNGVLRDYSVIESTRDKAGLSDYASAIDIGDFRVRTRRGTFTLRSFNAWLVDLCRKGHPLTADIREVIYTLDGKTVRRWDRLGRRTTGDSSHLFHTHISEFRDARGRRMPALINLWLNHIGLIAPVPPAPEEDEDMPTVITGQLEQGKAIVVVVPPVQGGGAKWGRAWLAIGSDFLDAKVRVMVHNGITWTAFFSVNPVTTVPRSSNPVGKELPKGCQKISLRWEPNPDPTALAVVGYRIEYAQAA